MNTADQTERVLTDAAQAEIERIAAGAAGPERDPAAFPRPDFILVAPPGMNPFIDVTWNGA